MSTQSAKCISVIFIKSRAGNADEKRESMAYFHQTLYFSLFCFDDELGLLSILRHVDHWDVTFSSK